MQSLRWLLRISRMRVSTCSPSRWENEVQVREKEKRYQFLAYTSDNRAQHVGNGFERDLQGLVLRFLKCDGCLHNVVCVNRLQKGSGFEPPPNKTLPLHLTAFWGLTHIMSILIGEGADVDAENDNGHTPLYLATLEQHYETALLLLDSRANLIIMLRPADEHTWSYWRATIVWENAFYKNATQEKLGQLWSK